jgi:hypothetical protein
LKDNDWGISGYTPLCLVLAPKAIHEKVKYLRWTDGVLSFAEEANSESQKYRHNLYESWVVFFWSYIESLSEEVCNHLENTNFVKVKRKNLKSNSKLDSVFNYIELVCNENFPSEELRRSLESYRIVRNLCAHGAGGEVSTTKENESFGKNTLIEYGGGFQNVSTVQAKAFTKLNIQQSNGVYCIDSDFCEGLFKFGVNYLIELISVTNTIGERMARFQR